MLTNKRILIIRSLDILTDTRVQRYEKWYKENNLSYHVLGWDRTNQNITRTNTSYYTLIAGYNMGIEGIKYRMKWNGYVLKYLIRHRKEYDVIHACDFDTILPSLMMKMIRKKVIFDIFDWFSDEVKTGKKIVDLTINTLEKMATKLADLTILCEEERIEQINTNPKKYIVVPNIPDANCIIVDVNRGLAKQEFTIGYVGGFYPDRGLLELLEVIKNKKNITLEISGFGNKDIEDRVTEYQQLYSNIIFSGKVEYDKAVEIMQSCDVLYAMYYKVNRNNVYAAPNKFYESIFLEKPIITTKGTLVGSKVEKEQIGFVIEEGYEALKKLLDDLDNTKLEDKKISLQKCKAKYKDRFATCMIEYAKFIKEEK